MITYVLSLAYMHVPYSSIKELALIRVITYQVLEENSTPVPRSKGCPDFAVPPRFRWVCTLFMRTLLRTLLIYYGRFLAVYGTFCALQYLPLSDVTVLKFITPILIGLSGAVFLREPFSLRVALAGCKHF